MSQTLYFSLDTVEPEKEDTVEHGREDLADEEPAVAAFNLVLLQ